MEDAMRIGKMILIAVLLGLLVALGRTFSSGTATQAQEAGASFKIAVVNIEKVFNNYKKRPFWTKI